MAKKKQAVQFSVSIQKVLEKMKAIVDGKKEAEFLEKCLALGEDRFVIVNSGIVSLVKKFLADNELSDNLRTSATFSAKVTAALDDDETCFKH
jgi:hypothetical protein